MVVLNIQRYPSSEGNGRIPCNEDSCSESSSEGNGKVPSSVDTSFRVMKKMSQCVEARVGKQEQEGIL